MPTQRCNSCMAVFGEELTECPECGRDDCLMYPYEEQGDRVIDVSDQFKTCEAAARRGKDCLILRKLKTPFERFDGVEADYELEYRWLSQENVFCVLGNEFTYWTAAEIKDWQNKENLFEAFQLFA